jgi:N-acetyl-gamma-glutamyl-phosphate reductase
MSGKRVAVIGASGYGGLQTLRLLQGHPEFRVTFLGGERSSGKRWSELVPFLPLSDDLVVRSPDAQAIADAADFAVLSLPNGLAAQLVPELLIRGVRVVDLSADYRYRSLAQWQEVYATEARQVPRADDDLCQEAVYGLVEWEAARIAGARLVAAPGCFPTSSLLALLPFLQQGLIENRGIVIDAKTGTSGGGRAAKEHLLLAEAAEAVAPYGVVGHRHTSEIEQIASQSAGHEVQVQFTPHLMPMVRGLLATVYARLRDPGLTADDCTTLPQSLRWGAAGRHLSLNQVGAADQPLPAVGAGRQAHRPADRDERHRQPGQGPGRPGRSVPEPDGVSGAGHGAAAAAVLSLRRLAARATASGRMRCSCRWMRAVRLSWLSSLCTGTAACTRIGPESTSGSTRWAVQPVRRTPVRRA